MSDAEERHEAYRKKMRELRELEARLPAKPRVRRVRWLKSLVHRRNPPTPLSPCPLLQYVTPGPGSYDVTSASKVRDLRPPQFALQTSHLFHRSSVTDTVL